MEVRTGAAMAILERMGREWPEEKMRAFVDEWKALEVAGAQIAEVQIIGSRIIGHPSEDFTRHLEKWGVATW